VNYLYGDSSESDLGFNYLAFIREVVDVAVVLVEHEVAVGSSDRRRAKEKESALQIQSIEELGRHSAALFDPVVKEYADSPVGRAAGAITAAVRDVIAVETAKVKTALTGELEILEKEDQKLRARSTAQLDKLLRAYDLPEATRSHDITWTTGAPKKLQLTQHAAYGVDAVFEAPVPATSVFATADLRVDKFADNVEVSSVEAGGWIKKSDKLVPYKLGRAFITKITTGPTGTTLRLRITQDANASGFNLVVRGIEMTLERVGDAHDKDKTAREYQIDDKNRPAIKQLIEKIEAAARELTGEGRALVSVAIDHRSLAEHPHPQVLAERLINAIAPTVKDIATHSSNPNELVLRRMLADDRREEIFISTAELAKKIDTVPEAYRKVFAPLGIERRTLPRARPVTMKPPTVQVPVRTVPPRPPPTTTSSPVIAAPEGAVTVDTIDLATVDLLEPDEAGKSMDAVPVAKVVAAAAAAAAESKSTKRPTAVIVDDENATTDEKLPGA
jgi:hypothetical protein